MPRLKLTDRTIKALRAPQQGQIDYFDDNPRLFGVRVSQSGHRAFIVLYRVGGMLRRLTLGTYPHLSLAAARQKAKDALHDVAHGGDPAAAKREDRRAETFGELADEYLRHAKLNKRSWKEDERILNHDLLPAWRTRKAKTIARRDVSTLVTRIAEDRESPIMANRTFALARHMFAFALEREIVPGNPCAGMKRPAVEQSRDRILSDDELRSLWKALPALPKWFGVAVKLYLFTAQRHNEVLKMHRAELDLDTGWWTIPASRTKNGMIHRVPLTAYTHEVLTDWLQSSPDSEWTFPSPRRDGPLATVQKPFGLLRDTVGLDFTTHDLRRTASSTMTRFDVGREDVSRVLNHLPRDVTGIYDRHTYDRQKRRALEKLTTELLKIVERPANETTPSHSLEEPATSEDTQAYLH